MGHGGRRPGAGRPRGSKTIFRRKGVVEVAKGNASGVPLEAPSEVPVNGTFDPTPREVRRLLWRLANDERQPGAARVGACKTLLGVVEVPRPDPTEELNSRITERAISLMSGGRMLN
jgi:hypothetical protein